MCDYYVESGALYSIVLNRKNNNDFLATQNSEQFPDVTLTLNISWQFTKDFWVIESI